MRHPSHAPSAHGPGHADHGDGDPGHDDHGHPTPQQRLRFLLGQERSDLTALLVYTVLSGMFGLAVPLAAQSLVNTIAAGFSLQPLIVLTLLVLGGLVLAGSLQLMQLCIAETVQQRIFARVALTLAQRLPRIRHAELEGKYGPELVNRFFDVITVQKSLSKLLLDGITAVLQATVGLVLIAFYNPLLLGFAAFLLLAFLFIVFVLGYGGLRSSISKSIQKYRVANWLEELARCQTSFKTAADPQFLMDRADSLVVSYLKARKRYFTVIFRQAMGSYLFQAVASAGTLGIGGWLVINRQLTLGQLVAAELVVVTVLAAMDKLIRQAEQVYDLLTALDKIGHVTDLPVERADGHPLPPSADGARVDCRGVRFSYRLGDEVLAGLDLRLHPGERVSLVGISGAGKSTLASLLCGLDEPSHGAVEIDGVEVRSIHLPSLRRVVSLVGDNHEIFDGTVEENVVAGRPHVSLEDLRWALEMVQMTDDLAAMPQGIRTPLVSGGGNISHGQVQRLLIARAIVDRPRLLILDEAFTGIDERTKLAILDAIYSPDHRWTILDISHDAEVVMRSDTVHLLADGRILESGPPARLACRLESRFSDLFPDLTRQILGRAGGPTLDLAEIPGLGPARRAALSRAGVECLEDLLRLSLDELARVPGIGPQQSRKIREYLDRRGLHARR